MRGKDRLTVGPKQNHIGLAEPGERSAAAVSTQRDTLYERLIYARRETTATRGMAKVAKTAEAS